MKKHSSSIWSSTVDVPEDFRFVYRGPVPAEAGAAALLSMQALPHFGRKAGRRKLKVGTKVMVDGTPGTIERMRKSAAST